MKKKRKGFTLIELLAVIVILGLLMAIAIPSVTKYITQSRKKTVSTSIGNYMGALTNQVNDMEYVFTGTNTIYAVPIECIALERGGTNPFGNWLHANSKYWAYVLVQYDDATSSYTYGFTFKDSAGYGLYPTTSEKLDENGKQIQQDLNLAKPINGSIENITAKANWNGFIIDDNTQLHVLEAAADGVQGDGVDTCTLCQKGKNYEEVEEEKLSMSNTIYYGKHYVMFDNTTSYSYIFLEDGSVSIYINCNKEESYPAGTVNFDSQYIYFGTDPIATISDNKKTLSMIDGSGVFNLDETGVCSPLYDSVYADLPVMISISQFIKNGDISIDLMPSWVNNLDEIRSITLENKINIPSGVVAEDYSAAGNGKVMTYLRSLANGGYDLVIQGDGKIYANPNSFYAFGIFSNVNKINNIELLDTSKVTNMSYMFANLGVSELDLSFLNTSNVKDMSYMFKFIGNNSTTGSIKLHVGFDTSNVTNMEGMFYTDGTPAPIMTLSLGDKFDTSKVTNMSHMFLGLGHNNEELILNLGDKFDTSNVTNMDYMMHSVGFSDDDFIFDCSSWNVDKVTSYQYFGNKNKIIYPNFK